MLSRLRAALVGAGRAVHFRGNTHTIAVNSSFSGVHKVYFYPYQPFFIRNFSEDANPISHELSSTSSKSSRSDPKTKPDAKRDDSLPRSKKVKHSKQSLQISETKSNPRRKSNKRPSKRKRRPKFMSKEPRAVMLRWPGLKIQNGETLPQAYSPMSLQELQSHSLSCVINTFCSMQPRPMQVLIKTIHAIRARGEVSTEVFDAAISAMIQRVIQEARRNDKVATISTDTDLAMETLLRCIESFDARPGATFFTQLVQRVKQDPRVELRAPRAWSIFRLVRGMQIKQTADLVYETFEACVEGVDVQSAAVLMDYATENGFGEDREVDYYNGIMYSALLREDYNTTSIAHEELLQKGVEPNTRTENLFLALCLERDDDHAAKILLSALKRKIGRLDDVTVAAMIRRAGRKRMVKDVLKIFREYERTGWGKRKKIEGEREKVLMLSRADPIYSVFHALRACSAAVEAAELWEYLKKVHGMMLPRFVLELVVEACWRGNRLDLAREVRGDKNGEKDREEEESR